VNFDPGRLIETRRQCNETNLFYTVDSRSEYNLIKQKEKSKSVHCP